MNWESKDRLRGPCASLSGRAVFWKDKRSPYFGPIPKILRMEEGDRKVVALQKARENEERVKRKQELVMDENYLTQHFGLQMQFKVTSTGDERNLFFLYFAAACWKVFSTFKENAQWKMQHINCTVWFRTFTAMFSEGKFFYKAVPLILSITQVWLIICYYSCCYYLPRPFIVSLPIHFQLFFFHYSGTYIYD